MAAGKLFNLIALTALALFASSLGPIPVNALSTGHIQHAHRHIAHEAVVRRKRGESSKRCKPRPSSAAPAPSSTPNKPTPAPSQPPKSSQAPEPPKSSAAPPPPPPPPSGGNNNGLVSTQGGKLSLAWPNGGDASLLKTFVTGRVHSMYTWSPFCPSNTDGIKCMPMMWGDKDASAIQSLVSKPATDANNVILFINEPNEPGQSNMSPQHACDLYHQYLKAGEGKGYKYVTPATSSNPNGLTWVKNFFDCCKDCHFDAVAIHWYDTTLKKFQDYVELWHTTFNMPIFITEYALQNFNGGAQPSFDQVVTFHKQAAAWLEQQDYVELYAPFGFMNDMSGVNTANQLMSGSQPTALGWDLLLGKF